MNAVAAWKPGRRMPGIPEHFQEFLLCILFHLFLPAMPLLAEAAVLGRVEGKTLMLFFAIFPLSIGVTSRNRLMFGATVVVSLMFSILFGLLAGGTQIAPAAYHVGYLCLSAIVIIHCCERYNRHVADRDPFWEFNRKGSSK
jgi:hypothetical protein